MYYDTRFTLPCGHLQALDNGVDGPIIIALHGFLDNAASLSLLYDALPGFRIIALDLPGHGGSYHKSIDAHYNQADYLQDLYTLITSENWTDVILIGHSLGGILASLYAGLFPEHVKAVVSIDACGPLTKEGEHACQQMRDSIISRHGKLSKNVVPVDLEKAVDARCKVSDINAEHARIILKRNITEVDGKAVWRSDARLRTISTLRLTEAQAKSIMSTITCPVLFIAASNSFKQAESVFEQRRHWFKNARCEVVEGGHHVHMEQPEKTSALIRNFITQM